MARIRTIKPEFFTSDDICALSAFARLLYIGLWCEADREGRLEWKPRSFKRRYLPDDELDIEALCAELLERGLVKLYGEGLAYIPQFSKHQHINPRESLSTLDVPPDFQPPLPQKVDAALRLRVMERDGNKCVRCGRTDDLTLDHILPQSLGGPHVFENLRCMCRPCNSGRPVGGEALDWDLAKDGFTLDELRVKFEIDASRRVGTRANQDMHAQGGREGKGKEGKESTRDAATTGSRLPADWQPSPDELRWARDARPDLAVTAEIESFRDYWIAKPGKDGRKTDWTATWRNWIRRANAPRGHAVAEITTGASVAASRAL